MTSPVCAYCGKRPEQLGEYLDASAETGLSPDDYVREEEGTYDPATDRFCCTDCYISLGMPTRRGEGWKAGDDT